MDAPICETGLCAFLVCVKTIATLSESPRACSPVCVAGVPVSSAPFMCTIFVEQRRWSQGRKVVQGQCDTKPMQIFSDTGNG